MIARMRLRNRNQELRKPIDRQVAFLEFKQQEEGRSIEASILQCRATLLERRMDIKTHTDHCNSLKSEIDGARQFLEQKQNARKARNMASQMSPDVNTRTEGFIDADGGGEDEVIDEAELNKLKELKDLKKQYRDAFNALKNTKKEAQFTAQAIDNAKQQLVQGFEQWYEDNFDLSREQGQQQA